MDNINTHIDNMAAKYDIRPDIFRRLITNESGGNQSAVSPKGATGLTQLMPSTAKELGVDPTDPYQNIEGGAKYLRKGLDKFGGDYTQALAGFNAGPNHPAVVKRDWNGLPSETRKYLHLFGDLLIKPANASEIPEYTSFNTAEAPAPSDGVPEFKSFNTDSAPVNVPVDASQSENIPEFKSFVPETNVVPPMSKTKSFLKGGVQGATFGFGDEIDAGYYAAKDALTGKGDLVPSYKKYRDEARAANKQAESDNPGSYTAGSIAGSLAIPLKKATTVADIVKLGTMYGAGSGLGTSESKDLSGVAVDTAKGAGIGGVGGGVLGVASRIPGGVATALDDVLGPANHSLSESGVPITTLDRMMASDRPITRGAGQMLDYAIDALPFANNRGLRQQQMNAIRSPDLIPPEYIDGHNIHADIQSLIDKAIKKATDNKGVVDYTKLKGLVDITEPLSDTARGQGISKMIDVWSNANLGTPNNAEIIKNKILTTGMGTLAAGPWGLLGAPALGIAAEKTLLNPNFNKLVSKYPIEGTKKVLESARKLGTPLYKPLIHETNRRSNQFPD